MLVPPDVLQRKLRCGVACAHKGQCGIVAIPCATLFVCQRSRELEEAALRWKGRCLCLQSFFCNVRLLSCQMHEFSWCCSTSENDMREGFTHCTAAFVAPMNKSRGVILQGLRAPTAFILLYSFCEVLASEMFSQVIFTC